MMSSGIKTFESLLESQKNSAGMQGEEGN